MPPRLSYGDDSAWSDVIPLPQDDGGPTALATIAYTDEYREAMSYLRAVMASNEHSERVLVLTAHIIDLNPAHYTVWLYRAKTLQVLSSDLHAELGWLNATALKYIKNYQIWHHRQTLITLLATQEPASLLKSKPPGDPPSTASPETYNFLDAERVFLNAMLDKDEKNYHVWSYRQWLVRKFGLWDRSTSSSSPSSSTTLLSDKPSSTPEADTSDELSDIVTRLRHDLRNNSAWNHRFFVVFGRYENHASSSTETIPGPAISDDILEREIAFAQDAIRMAPQNESSWNYLRGLLRRFERPVKDVEAFVREFADVSEEGKGRTVRSSYALDVLAEVYAQEAGKKEMADRALELLATRYDIIRAGYWTYRRGLLVADGKA